MTPRACETVRGAERLHEELVPLAARWVEPSQRKGTLTAYAREAEAKSLDLLDRSLGEAHRRLPGEAIQKKLLAAASGDIAELLPQLEPRARELAKLAIDKLEKRGEREEKVLFLIHGDSRISTRILADEIGVSTTSIDKTL